jgi:glutamyl-tRNA(Gln) amidotransferase subunit E
MAQTDYDYKKLGLRCGIEIHQQLKTKSKLFCRCPNEMQGTRDPEFKFIRSFRPVLGETGKFDQAMLLEFKKENFIEYEGFHDKNCSYEMDETPPFACDPEAFRIALEIGLLLKLNMVDELHICRKNYVDGSVPGGFQRTMIVGINGKIPLANSKMIGIELLCLEEDACRRIGEEGRKVIFRLDRLGIPLVEVATAPDINDPQEARETALRLGLLLRSTGKVKKVLGAIRQDINVSIKEGSRVEVKGVQKLDWIPDLVKNEVRRQVALVKIRDEMKQRGITAESLKQTPIDITDLLKATECNFINKGIKEGEIVLAVRAPNMKGLWGIEIQEGRRFGTEVANKVKVIVGLKGLIHSDEDLDKYKLSKSEIDAIKSKLSAAANDAFVIIVGKKERVIDAMDIVVTRIKNALTGVPPETRRALENCNTEFMRDLHGGSRLYPDTDSREIVLDKKLLADVKKSLSKYPWELTAEYSQKYGLPADVVETLIMDGNLALFTNILKNFTGKPTVVASTLIESVKSLHRDGKDIDNLSDDVFIQVFNMIESQEMSKEAREPVLEYICDHPQSTIKEAISKLNISSVSTADLSAIVKKLLPEFQKLIEERGLGAKGPYMGAVMKEVRGKIDGSLVSQAVQTEIEKFIAKSKPATKSESKPEAKSEPKSETKSELKSETKSDAKSEPKTELKSETKSEAKSETKSQNPSKKTSTSKGTTESKKAK